MKMIYWFDVVVDSKCDYPAACNAMETLLVHRDIFHDVVAFDRLTSLLKIKGVALHPGPRLSSLLPIQAGGVSSLRKEYGSLECSIEVVSGIDEAVKLINSYGSSHTDTIVTEDGKILIHTYTIEMSLVIHKFVYK